MLITCLHFHPKKIPSCLDGLGFSGQRIRVWEGNFSLEKPRDVCRRTNAAYRVCPLVALDPISEKETPQPANRIPVTPTEAMRAVKTRLRQTTGRHPDIRDQAGAGEAQTISTGKCDDTSSMSVSARHIH